MKPEKPKRRKKPPTLPNFIATTNDGEFPKNLRLARYGNKIDGQDSAIALVERISDWRKRLPEERLKLRAAGNSDAQIAEFESNTAARVSWCALFEDAIEQNEVEFFEAIALVLLHRREGRTLAHPIEFHAWNETFRLLWATQRYAPDGKHVIGDWPTKGQLMQAVSAKGFKVASRQFARVLHRLHLDWLPTNKSGPKTTRIA